MVMELSFLSPQPCEVLATEYDFCYTVPRLERYVELAAWSSRLVLLQPTYCRQLRQAIQLYYYIQCSPPSFLFLFLFPFTW